jgi:transcriptional regulator with XRE-family HTH domain
MKGVSMSTIDRIRALCAKNHTSIKALEKELGFSNGSLAKAATIKDDRLQRIAEYFNVTVDYHDWRRNL